jgi:DNA-binding response OmpR family regulator
MTRDDDTPSAKTADGRRVLIVDDERDSADLLCAILESRGFTVSAAYGGAEALRRIGEEPPDLLLLDVMMPQMSGLQVLEHLRRTPSTARIPTILVTAKGRDDDVILGYQLGADYYITKPCTASQLLYGLDLVLNTKRRRSASAAPRSQRPTRVLGG